MFQGYIARDDDDLGSVRVHAFRFLVNQLFYDCKDHLIASLKLVRALKSNSDVIKIAESTKNACAYLDDVYTVFPVHHKHSGDSFAVE